MVGAKCTVRLPSGVDGLLGHGGVGEGGQPSSTTSVMSNTALRSGSSQQGKARRASVASIWVVAMVCGPRRRSVKVLR